MNKEKDSVSMKSDRKLTLSIVLLNIYIAERKEWNIINPPTMFIALNISFIAHSLYFEKRKRL